MTNTRANRALVEIAISELLLKPLLALSQANTLSTIEFFCLVTASRNSLFQSHSKIPLLLTITEFFLSFD